MPGAVRLARPGEVNYAAVDGFTVVHAALGAALGAMGVGPLPALLTSLVWENVEPSLKRRYRTVFPSALIDTTQNKLGDTAAWMLGWYLASRNVTP